jgi:hypothetical protein
MTAAYKFVQVDDVLFEPRLKLRVTAVILYDGRGECEIQISHDHRINARRLTMAAVVSIAEARAALAGRPAPPRVVPFRSGELRRVAGLTGSLKERPGEYNFVVERRGLDLAAEAGKVADAVGATSAEGFEILHQILRAAVRLPLWDERPRYQAHVAAEKGRPAPPPTMVGVFLERPLAETLAAHSSFEYDAGGLGMVAVARRQARP